MSEELRASPDANLGPASDAGVSEPAPPLSPTGPLLLWLGIQTAALAAGAFRVAFWAQAPAAAELLALDLLVIAQIGASALLFPMLLWNWTSTIGVIATAWPFILLAGMLSAAELGPIGLAGAYLTGWILALAIGRVALSSSRTQMIAVAAVLLWAAGGPVLLFVRTEYNAGAGAFGVGGRIGLGPIVAGISLISSRDATAWIVLAIAMTVALLLVLAKLAKHKLRLRSEPQISCRS